MIESIAKLLGRASQSPSARDIQALSRQVADLSVQSVCELVGGPVQSMSFSEARGYVRARAVGLVRSQARLAIGQQLGADLFWLEEVTRSATEQIIPLVLRQTGVGLLQASPLRLAA
jgi:hypothetical protein